jgi:hypothetical protein
MPRKIVAAGRGLAASIRVHPAGVGGSDADGVGASLSAPADTNCTLHSLQRLLPFQRRAVLFCVTAIVFVLVFYEIVNYGFPAVVNCEVQSYRFQHQARGLAVELASINGCGL